MANSMISWWARAELNCRHSDFQSDALPTELPAHLYVNSITYNYSLLA